jgi:Uma2 family endonuclease
MTRAAAIPHRRRMSIDEYLRFESDAERKHEYVDGEVLDMAGSTGEHSLITMNLGAELRTALKGKPCRVYDGNLRARIHNRPFYNYPDLQVICGGIEYDPDDDRNMSALNPRLIVEVLSPSTEAYTRGKKFRRYREIPSLREYVLVSQNEPVVETFYRQDDGTWALATFQGADATAQFRSIGATVPLGEIFAGITFPVPADQPPVAGDNAGADQSGG